MNDILEIELQLLKDDSIKSIKTTLKNGEEIILYSPKYVKLLENENTQLDRTITELEEYVEDMITPKPVQGGGIGFVNSINPELFLDKIQKLKEKYKC